MTPMPVSLHWLGDRHEADATKHAVDMRGCVMYFDRQSDCLQFMRWLESRPAHIGEQRATGILREIVDAFDKGGIEFNSPDVGDPDSGIPYHPWHEEWLHYARLALTGGE